MMHAGWSSYIGTNNANALVFTTNEGRFWFSYRTLVAFQAWSGSSKLVVRRNEWGNTTGRHLNAIDEGRKGERLSGDEFFVEYNRQFKGVA